MPINIPKLMSRLVVDENDFGRKTLNESNRVFLLVLRVIWRPVFSFSAVPISYGSAMLVSTS